MLSAIGRDSQSAAALGHSLLLSVPNQGQVRVFRLEDREPASGSPPPPPSPSPLSSPARPATCLPSRWRVWLTDQHRKGHCKLRENSVHPVAAATGSGGLRTCIMDECPSSIQDLRAEGLGFMLSRHHDCSHRWNHGVVGTKTWRAWYSKASPLHAFVIRPFVACELVTFCHHCSSRPQPVMSAR